MQHKQTTTTSAAILKSRTSSAVYTLNKKKIEAAQFYSCAYNPNNSVVVEACAGSGKTSLLVTRTLHLLLQEDCQPNDLLIITFTRKAAQEIYDRLMHVLKKLALCTQNDAAFSLLKEHNFDDHKIKQALPYACSLYKKLLSNDHRILVYTFHSWFAQLLKKAPIPFNIPKIYKIAEIPQNLANEARKRFVQNVSQEGPAAARIRRALGILYNTIGNTNTHKLLHAFVEKRAEWWAATQLSKDAPLQQLFKLCNVDMAYNPCLEVWSSHHTLANKIRTLASLLGKGSIINQKRAMAIEELMNREGSFKNFIALTKQFYDQYERPRANLKTKRFKKALTQYFRGTESTAIRAFDTAFNQIADQLQKLQHRANERRVFRLNRSLFIVGDAFLEVYQTIKTERTVLDFTDLEWKAYTLLTTQGCLTYVRDHPELSYKHMLIDEFQDTNALQWRIVRLWLGVRNKPKKLLSVFIVGDPKQSIYSFRRADPRIFSTMRTFLKKQGAFLLQTCQTHRNAKTIVQVLNDSFLSKNKLFRKQTTTCTTNGDVWYLPLVSSTHTADMPRHPVHDTTFNSFRATEASTGIYMRNPLTTSLQSTQQESTQHYIEGSVAARAVVHARKTIKIATKSGGLRLLEWRDVIFLIRNRLHISSYEQALREANIPFTSDNTSDLYGTLAVADLIALLKFLFTPQDRKLLAQILKSPIIGALDTDLITLAHCAGEDSWWHQVQLLSKQKNTSVAIKRAAYLLSSWIQLAPHTSAYEILDLIIYEGDLINRYAQATPIATRTQVESNIKSFIASALDTTHARYVSVPSFLHTLENQGYRLPGTPIPTVTSQTNVPITTTSDVARILTVHSAKGLEAPVIVVLDANHIRHSHDSVGVLYDWAPNKSKPTHFSVFCGPATHGAARSRWLNLERAARKQEDWNLLYVATTRAKQLLIVSGIAVTHTKASFNGIQKDSWYNRLHNKKTIAKIPIPPQISPKLRDGSLLEQSTSPAERRKPASLNNGNQPTSFFATPPVTRYSLTRSTASDSISLTAETRKQRESLSSLSKNTTSEGIALHALLDIVTSDATQTRQRWPCSIPSAKAVALLLTCSLKLANTMRAYAKNILTRPSLERFFNPVYYQRALNEVEIYFSGRTLRCDRLIVFRNEVWVLDYKRSIPNFKQSSGYAQLLLYKQAVSLLFQKQKIRAAFVSLNGSLVEQA